MSQKFLLLTTLNEVHTCMFAKLVLVLGLPLALQLQSNYLSS